MKTAQTNDVSKPQEWIEVDATCFDTTEGGIFKTTLMISRCKQMKRYVKRVRDAVTLEADSREELDQKVAAYVERPNVKLLDPQGSEERAGKTNVESPKSLTNP